MRGSISQSDRTSVPCNGDSVVRRSITRERSVYAIFEDGGRQYKVSEGDHLLVDLRDNPVGGNTIKFDKVLMVGEGAGAKVGAPFVAGASVAATVLQELKTDKVIGIKFSRRKGYKKKWGHRQNMLRVQVDKISG